MKLRARTDIGQSNGGNPVRAQRRPVKFAGMAALGDGTTFEIAILDLSYDGCRITSPIALLPGIVVNISASGLGALTSQVRWYADGQAGLCFTPDRSLRPPQTPRRAERSDISCTVLIRRSGRQSYQTRATNLSMVGCKVEFVERPEVGERLWIRLEGFNGLEADVRWIDGFHAGLEFRHPIHAAVFEQLLARHSN